MLKRSSPSGHHVKPVWNVATILVDKIESLMLFCAAVFMLMMMLGIVLDAAMRYLFNYPLSIAYELTEFYVLPAIIFFTISHTMKKKGHIGVTLFHRFFSARTINAIDKAGLTIGTVLFAMIAWQGAKLTYFAWINNYITTGAYKWPLYVGYAFIPLGAFVMSLRCLIDLLNSFYPVVGEKQ